MRVDREISFHLISPYILTEQDIDRLQSILQLYEGTHSINTKIDDGYISKSATNRN